MVVVLYKALKRQLTLWLICLIVNMDLGTPSCPCYLPHLPKLPYFLLSFRLYFPKK